MMISFAPVEALALGEEESLAATKAQTEETEKGNEVSEEVAKSEEAIKEESNVQEETTEQLEKEMEEAGDGEIAVYANENEVKPLAATTRVYVYTKVSGSTAGLVLNGSGWYTLGYVDVSGTYTWPSSTPSLSTVVAAVKSGSFVHEYNTSININDITFNNVSWANGADGYVPAIEEGGWRTLHLDGSITIRNKYGTVTIQYVDKATGAAIADSSQGNLYQAGTALTFGEKDAKNIAGYKYDSVSESSYTVAANQNKIITIYYVKDNSQTQPTNYTVKYTLDGVEQTADAITVDGNAWINDNPAKIAIAESGIPTPADKYKGYKLDPANPAYPEAGEKVESGSVFTVNYVKDNSQTQATNYTIKYTINGKEQKTDTITVEGTAWVNDNPAKIAIAKDGIPTPVDKYTGYKLDPANPEYPAAGEMVKSGRTFTVNYVKDETQTQPTKYTVKYTLNGVEQPADTITVEGTAWVNDAPAKIAIAEAGIPTPADKYKGYKLDTKNPKYPAAGEKVESGSVFSVNYVKDNSQTQPTNYTVKYTVNGVEQATDTITVEGTAWINDNPAKIAIAKIGIPTPANKYKGYKLDPANPEYPAAGEKVESGSVFTVNYVKDETQTNETKYTVKYTIDGKEQ